MDSSPSDFSVYGIFPARILEWVSTPFTRGSFWSGDWTHVLCIAGKLPFRPPGKPIKILYVWTFVCTLSSGVSGSSVPFSSVAQLCPTFCDPTDCSTPGFPVHHQLPELAQTHVHHIGDAIQPSHPLLFPSPPTFNLPQHQDLFQWVSSSHQVAKVLEFQLQHQSFQWIFRTDFL